MSKRQIFQQKALDKLQKPLEIDRLFTITSSTNWLLLAAVILILFSGCIWAVFGVMADKVKGYGIIIDSGGVSAISHTSNGTVKKLLVHSGDFIKAGQVIAYIDQPKLEQSALLGRERLEFGKTNTDMRERVAQYNSTKEELVREEYVVSQFDGLITEERVREGDFVLAGAPIYSLRQTTSREDVLAIVYVPALEGKKIKQGMTIQISPGSVDASQYGSLVGRVTEISQYPVSSDSIMVWGAKNQEMTSWIVGKTGGSMVAVQVELTKDPDTPSGYLWTSVVGPDEEISAGTLCTATAIVSRDAPIVRAYRKFSQWVRSD